MNWLYSRWPGLKQQDTPWQKYYGEGLSLRGRLLSKYHRLAWKGYKALNKPLSRMVTSLNIVRLRLKDRANASYSKVSLKDKFVEDFGPVDGKIPLKWDSGAEEVVYIPRETAKKHNGVRFILFKPGSGHKGGIKR